MVKGDKKELMRTIKFTLFSLSAGIIQIASFTLFEEVFHFEHWICNLVALVLSVLWNFTFNRKFTFCSAANIPLAMLKVALFYVVYAPLSAWAMDVLTGEDFMWNEYLVQILTMTVNLVTEYLYQRFFVFGKSLDTQIKK
ncbi:MAG: GtrA family protein [Clostridia bacterium]|nr:GtrA family protein [Clostridia bacterium]